MTTVAIYTRLSSDTTGQQTATHRQQSACEAFATIRGWDVVHVYEDVDLSAYRQGVVRPAYEQLLHAIKSKRVDGIVAWKLDRLVRRSADFERLWETCDRSGVFLTSAMEPIDTSTDLGLALVRVLVAFASLESATTSVRLRAKFQERAEGLVPHTTAAAYGIKKGWTELEPEQVKRIREAAERVLAGDSLRSIVLDWKARGVPSHTGKVWSHAALRGLLLQPRLAGLLVHNGDIMGRGNWPAIIDEDMHQRLRTILLDPKRRTVKSGKTPHLLTGLLRCGICGENLYRTVQIHDGKDYFVCPPPPKGCTRIAVRMHLITEAIVQPLFERLHSKRYGAQSDAHWSGLQDVVVDRTFDELATSLRDLAGDYYQRQEITRAQFLDARDALYVQAEARLGGDVMRPASLGGVHNMPQLRERWATLDLDEQRAILRSEIAYVTVNPAGKRGRMFDPSRVVISWNDELMHQQRSTTWLSTAEVSSRLEISRRQVSRLVERGDLRGERLGPCWMFRRHDVDRLAAAAT